MKKNKFTHKVTVDEFERAMFMWSHIMNKNQRNLGNFGSNYFTTFIGAKDYDSHNISYPFFNVTETAYNKIMMLNSPHARTLLKAFKARTGYHKHIP